VDDRFLPGLYLELGSGSAADYAASRVDTVLATPGVVHASWWANVCRDRDDLPRVLPEFDVLGVYEVEDRFMPPARPAGLPGYHFVRTRRPGQGSLSGGPTVGLSLVLISPTEPGRAQELRDWGDLVHIRHIAAAGVPGYSMITPYEHAAGGDPRFLHLYEMDTDDPEAAFTSMTPRVRARLDDRDEFRRWARHDALRIMYVNSFRRLGERAA
jgi:hypothetical protein